MNGVEFHVLLIVDLPDGGAAITRCLSESRIARFRPATASSLEDGLKRLGSEHVDLVLLAITEPTDGGVADLRRLLSQEETVPVIVLGDREDEETAIQIVHAGAQDYLLRSRFEPVVLIRACIYAIERAQAQTKLLEAEERYRSIYENAVEGIFQTSPEGHYISANRALARIYGYDSPEDLMNSVRDISRMLYVEASRREEFVRTMQQHDVVNAFESPIYKKGGEVIWISENVRAVRDQRGRLLYYEGTVEDITGRKRAEMQLSQSEALYHSLVDAIQQAIFRKDLNERFTFGNQRFCDTLGKPLNEILGRTDFDFFPPELAAKYQKDDNFVLTTGKHFEAIEAYQPSDGETRYVQVLKTPIRDLTGQIIGLQGLFWDITERKRAEERERLANEALATSREELRRKNEMMEEDLKMANEIQLAMLPQVFPVFPAGVAPADSLLKFSHRYTPTGTVGGDFFNVFQISPSRAGIFICDVMGHGVRSALVTAMIRALVEELRNDTSDPGHLLTVINRDLRNILKQTGSPLFTTAFCLVVDVEKRTYAFSNAGHPKPFLVNRLAQTAERIKETDGKRRPALGLMADTEYPTFGLPMTPGDSIMLFTDGVFEVEGPGELLYSQEMLLELVRQHSTKACPEIFDTILRELKGFMAQDVFEDDICLVGVDVAETLP